MPQDVYLGMPCRNAFDDEYCMPYRSTSRRHSGGDKGKAARLSAASACHREYARQASQGKRARATCRAIRWPPLLWVRGASTAFSKRLKCASFLFPGPTFFSRFFSFPQRFLSVFSLQRFFTFFIRFLPDFGHQKMVSEKRKENVFCKRVEHARSFNVF